MVTFNLYRRLPSRTNNYLSQPCSLHSSFFRLCNLCLTLTQSYPLNTRGKLPIQGRVDGLYAFLKKVEQAEN